MSILFINAANQGMIFQVKNETVTLKGYVETEFSGRVNANFFDEVNLSLASNILCAEVNITQGNSSKIYKENCTLSINIVRDIPLIFNESKNTIIGDSELQRKYEECLTLKSQFDAGLNGCLRSKIEQGEYKENFTLCSTNLIVCQNDKTNVESKIGDLEKFKEDNKNQHWIWGMGQVVNLLSGEVLQAVLILQVLAQATAQLI